MAFSAIVTLLSLIASITLADAYWAFGGTKVLIQERLDSVVDSGQIGSHVHAVVGGSKFSETYDYDTLIQANCSTIEVQPDKSNYWAPQLYYQDQNTSEFTAIPTSFNVYYFPRNGPNLNQSVQAFPAGLKILAGNTNRRSYNASSFADQAVSFVCLDYTTDHSGDPDWAERPNFFDHACPNGMRAQIYFPSCWDGVNLDSADHTSHMSYQIQNFNGGDCPDSHPVQLVSIFYEMLVSVDQFPYWGAGSWVLANGDPTGYGFHGDFQNGWDVDVLQDAIDNCPDANGDVAACPPLQAAVDQDAVNACVIEGMIVDEDVGLTSPLKALPGCNPVWDGTGSRPTCPSVATPGLVSAQEPLPDGWRDIGCIAEGTSGRALTGASTTDPAMTKALCAAFCDERGFGYAGAEYADECYCGDAFVNGATGLLVTWSDCNMKCIGNVNEDCGGASRLSLMFNPTPGNSSPASEVLTKAASAGGHNVIGRRFAFARDT